MTKISDLGEVSGLRELEQALVEIGNVASKKIMRQAMMYATKPTLDAMKSFAPVGDGVGKDYKGNPKSAGRLKKTIKRKFKTKGIGRSYAEIDVGAMGRDAYYAKWVEFGTAPHFINRGANRVNARGKVINKVSDSKGTANERKMHPGSRPHPFIRPAWNMTKDQIITRFKDRLAQSIDAAIKKAS